MEGLVGILLIFGVLFVAAIFIIRAIVKLVFRGVSKAAGEAAYHGTKAVKGEEYADKHEDTIRGVATAVAAAGGVAIAADAADLGGEEEVFAGGMAADASGGFEEATTEELSNEGLDLDGDGRIEGFDTDGDGRVEQNIIGVEVAGTEEVEGYMREDGTEVESYARSEADDSTLNNLEPN
jgi:hypothetical protein